MEQHIADYREARLRRHENHMPWRMSGAVHDIEHEIAHGYLVAVFQPAVRREGAYSRKARALRLLDQSGDPEVIPAVRAFDGDIKVLGDIGHRAYVVDVRVSDQYFLDRDPSFLDCLNDSLGLTAGIDNGGFAAVLAA